MSNSVLQAIRPYFCGILNCTCVRSFIRAICGIHPFWRRSVCGGIILYCIYHRRTYLLGGIRRMWQGIEHCCTSFCHHLCRTYNYIRRTFFFPVKVHVLVAGETFQAHDTFIQNLKLRIKRCSAESCSIILVFCPVVSRIGTDMEAAMARVTEDKPVILVFMHHCHDASHMTNTTVQPTESKIMLVVHSVFLENKGLLACKENNQAVVTVRSGLKKCK